jgi:hypothetical protein
MRKLYGEVKALPLPDGGMRIEIASSTGERACIDLDQQKAASMRQQMQVVTRGKAKVRAEENPTSPFGRLRLILVERGMIG